jgi:hypothetical protein
MGMSPSSAPCVFDLGEAVLSDLYNGSAVQVFLKIKDAGTEHS